jgi:hypothetical protein
MSGGSIRTMMQVMGLIFVDTAYFMARIFNASRA